MTDQSVNNVCMSNTRPGPRSKSAGGRGGAKAAVGRPGEKVAPAKASKPASSKPASSKPASSRPASPKALASNRAERAAERRGAIIEAALDEFVARGFTATRIDDIASRAGVAKGTIYLHFKDKE